MTLKERIAQKQQHNVVVVMYSVDGARFQETALSMLDYKGSQAHKLIGSLVTRINNSQITVAEALAIYAGALK